MVSAISTQVPPSNENRQDDESDGVLDEAFRDKLGDKLKDELESAHLESAHDMEDQGEGDQDSESEILSPLTDRSSQKRLIEAILFSSPEPVSLKSLQVRLEMAADVGGILLELQNEYAARGVHLVRLEDCWAFRTAPDIGPYLAVSKKQEKKLSRAAMETLAIIAYHQPVTRAEIENIRGVATNKGTVDVLLEAGWIKPGRRRETPGRPVTWITTIQFLDEFGISELKDLPGLREMKSSGLLDTRPAIETLTPGLNFFGDENPDGQSSVNSQDSNSATPAYDEIGEFDQAQDENRDENDAIARDE